MQFINIVVHSVEDMNFRVHLQYDFTKLALDDYLEVKNKCSYCWRCSEYLCFLHSLINSCPLVYMCVAQRLKHTESDKLKVQIQAYLDNLFDVGTLLEDAETKNAALERVEELEESLSHVRMCRHLLFL